MALKPALNYEDQIEIELRTQIAYHLSVKYGSDVLAPFHGGQVVEI